MSGNSPSPLSLTPGVFAQTEAEAAAERNAAMMARKRADEEATREEILAAYADRSVQEALKAATAVYACASACADESNIAAAKSVLDRVTADAIVARARLREAQRLADIFAIPSE
jgi:hypothetical protein